MADHSVFTKPAVLAAGESKTPNLAAVTTVSPPAFQRFELPFGSGHLTLRDVLRRDYMPRTARWLLGEGENTILTQLGKSAWESALSLSFLWEAKSIFESEGEQDDMREEIDRKSPAVLRWLLSTVQTSHCGTYECWENVTWDTAVVLRVLSTGLDLYRAEFTSKEIAAFDAAFKSGLRWLFTQFDSWDSDIKYPFGAADVAQMAITILFFQEKHPTMFKRWVNEHHSRSRDVLGDVVRYLLYKKVERTFTVKYPEGGEDEICSFWWEDFFATSEVIEALGLFCAYCDLAATRQKQYERELVEIRAAVAGACTYCEHSQVDGMWGSHVDSIKIVYSYVKLSGLPIKVLQPSNRPFTPELHTTFKAIRWMCDEKQVFRDGSFLHTSFLTVFYALTLTEIYRTWLPAGEKIDKLYDDVVWSSPMRTTPERAKRMATEITADRLRVELHRMRASKLAYQRVVVVIVSGMVLLPTAALVAQSLGLIHWSIDFKVIKLNEGLTFLAVLVTLYLTVLGLLLRAPSRQDRED